MAASYPGTLPSLTNPTSTDKLNSPAHSTQHINANDEIEAIATELGVNVAGSATNLVGRLDDMDDNHSLMVFSFAGASTAAETSYAVIPYKSTVSAKAVPISGTTGTGASVTIYVTDTAGDDIVVGTFASAGTAGSEILTFTAGTSGTTGVASGTAICVVKASCATAYGCTVTVTAALNTA